MSKWKLKDLLPIRLMSKFPSGHPETGFENYIANKVPLEGLLASIAFALPQFLETKEGAVVRLVEHGEITLGTKFGSDIKTLERYNNLLNLDELYLLAEDASSHSEELVERLGSVLRETWRLALEMQFPDRIFEVELEEDLFDETGLCLTFSQK